MYSLRFGASALFLLVMLSPAPAAAIDDAQALALEFSGELLAPPALTAQIEGHLAAIRADNTFLQIIHPQLAWVPGDLSVILTASAFQEFLAGTYTGLDALHAVYGPVEVSAVYEFIRSIEFDFEANYHGAVLASIYDGAPGVAIASPSSVFGDGPDITMQSLGTYEFRFGWFDCPLGCVHNHYWLYTVTEFGEAILLNEWGDPLVGVDAPVAPATTALSLSPPRPNPARGATRISFTLPSDAHTALVITDVGGRQVRRLHDGTLPEGSHSRSWDGRDDRGRRVAAGTYFATLRLADGRSESERIVLVR